MIRTLVAVMLISTTAFADPPEPKFRAQTIDDKIQIGYGVCVADVDGDTKPDILLADKKQFVWYRNPTWEKFVIAENLTKRDNVCLAAQDLDADGKCELAVGGDWDPNDRENSGAVFYLIAPQDRTKKWEAVKLHAEPTVHRMKWMRPAEGGGLVVLPLHGRGKEGTEGSKFLLYHKPDDVRTEWRTELLDDSMHATHNFEVHDNEIFVAGREGVMSVLRKRTTDGKYQVTKVLLKDTRAAGEVRYNGFTVTIEPMHGNVLALYSQNEERRRVVLTDQMSEGHALALGQLIPREAFGIVAGWRGNGGGVVAFSGNGDEMRKIIVDDKDMACEDLCLADLNGDKKLDMIASGRATHNVKIYWNETAK